MKALGDGAGIEFEDAGNNSKTAGTVLQEVEKMLKTALSTA